MYGRPGDCNQDGHEIPAAAPLRYEAWGMDPHSLGPPLSTVPLSMVTTAFELPGYRVVKNLGVVRGIVVRSRSIVGSFFAGLQTLFGGNITLWTELCEHARQEAYDLMVRHAQEMGANGVIGMRYDANEVAQGATEVLAYGTAVVIEQAR